ncbi:MAG: outer membrane protein assembly factor BamB family protein [Candidatus Bathyarchaeia archaeon]
MENLIKVNFRRKSFALIAIVLMMTSALLMSAAFTAKASATDVIPGSPMQGATSGVVGDLSSGANPSVTMDTVAFLSVSPSPIGIGQTALVNMWTTPPISPNRFQSGYYVDIIRPDGTTETVGPMDSYPADATAWFQLTPDQTGTYQFKFRFTGEYWPNGTYLIGRLVPAGSSSAAYYLDTAYYKPASTNWQNLTVQSNLVSSWPIAALPTGYWTRPANVMNREWWSILGNYPPYGIVGGGSSWPADTNTYITHSNFVPYVQGPNTCHVEYKQQMGDAGIIGGSAGSYSLGGGAGTPSVIYNGRCYQTMTVPINGVPTSCAVCWDLQTGKQYYAIPTTSSTPGALGGITPNIISYVPPGTSGAAVAGEVGAEASGTYSVSLISIAGDGSFYKINPWTGAVTFNMSSTGYKALSPQLMGGIQGSNAYTGFYKDPYALSVQTITTAGVSKYYLINWTTAGTTTNFTQRIMGNVSLPFAVPTYPGGILGYNTFVVDPETNIMVWMAGLAPLGVGVYHGTWMMAVDMTTGSLLWNRTYTDMTRYSTACFGADHGIAICLMEGGYYAGFSERNGDLVWKTQLMDYPWGSDSFGGYQYISAYGMFYRCSYDGIYAFNWTNGHIVWHYVDPAVPFETPYTDVNGSQCYSFNGGGFVADGKLYTYNTEHTPTYPITRGWGLMALNITNGERVWRIEFSGSPGEVSDGYLVAGNGYDGKMYVFGKGESSTTLSAPQIAAQTGQSVILTGTVLDQSPAQPGTACVSASSMTTWMQYLHMQQPIDGLWHNETIAGVPVSLDAVDPNGNFVHISTVTTDGTTGTYGYTWTPTVAGDYKIFATFAGDDSYGSSFATTYATAVNAPTTTTPTTTSAPSNLATTSDLMTYIVAVGIAIILAVAIATVLILRKRP